MTEILRLGSPSVKLIHESPPESNEFDYENSTSSSNGSSVYSLKSFNVQNQKLKRSSEKSEIAFEKNAKVNLKTVNFLKEGKKIVKSCESAITDMDQEVSSGTTVVERTQLSKLVDKAKKPESSARLCGCAMEVSAAGKKLMRDIKCPTVHIKIRNGQLETASVYYVLLEPMSAKFKGQIAALLFSDPDGEKKHSLTTAELMPLVARITRTRAETLVLKPMLLYNCYKVMFQQGCKFKVNVIKFARQYVQVGSQLLKKLIIQDIKMIPEEILKILKPLQLSKKRVQTKPVKTSSQRKLIERTRKLSDLVPELRLRGLKASGGKLDFARWFETVPPDVLIDVDFRCDSGVLKKDFFRTAEMLDRYLGLPKIV